ncbi:hypothetical protein IWQ60_000529 [Tieghemiomyces parasiticus]|uniref:Uncharacterized protein n=1 Tax=Tieghemiomyces parasiticus TaxID=78921 RepID=A0A9W8AM50_9FUNG|nr:hypothetical protein IWQ60_000529 [Tieghemiomyces parasiticus]
MPLAPPVAWRTLAAGWVSRPTHPVLRNCVHCRRSTIPQSGTVVAALTPVVDFRPRSMSSRARGYRSDPGHSWQAQTEYHNAYDVAIQTTQAQGYLHRFYEALRQGNVDDAWLYFNRLAKFPAVASRVTIHDMTRLFWLINRNTNHPGWRAIGHELTALSQSAPPEGLTIEFLNERLRFQMLLGRYVAARDVLNRIRDFNIRPTNETYNIALAAHRLRHWPWLRDLYRQVEYYQARDAAEWATQGYCPHPPLVPSLDVYHQLYSSALDHGNANQAAFVWQEINRCHGPSLMPRTYHHRVRHLIQTTGSVAAGADLIRYLLAARLPVLNCTFHLLIDQVATAETPSAAELDALELAVDMMMMRQYQLPLHYTAAAIRGCLAGERVGWAKRILAYWERSHELPGQRLPAHPPPWLAAPQPTAVYPQDLYALFVTYYASHNQYAAAEAIVARWSPDDSPDGPIVTESWVLALIRLFRWQRDPERLQRLFRRIWHNHGFKLTSVVANAFISAMTRLRLPRFQPILYRWLIIHGRPHRVVTNYLVKHYLHGCQNPRGAMAVVDAAIANGAAVYPGTFALLDAAAGAMENRPPVDTLPATNLILGKSLFNVGPVPHLTHGAMWVESRDRAMSKPKPPSASMPIFGVQKGWSNRRRRR